MHDVLLLLIYRVPVVAFGILVLLTLALPAVHSLSVVGRLLAGRPARINWWVIGRVLPLVVAAIVAVPLIVMTRAWTADWQLSIGEVALVYLCVAAIFVPVALPLVQAYVERSKGLGALVYALLAILSLPVAAALATYAASLATQAIGIPGDVAVNRPVAFFVDNSVSRCTSAVFAVAPEGIVAAAPLPEWTLQAAYPPYFFFWADMTMKAAFLDFFEVFDCGFTNLRHNPNNMLVSSFVFFYRAFVSVIVLAVVALPFRRGGS
jgi:hypothetical protein